MSYQIELNESVASRRVVPFRLFLSNGTAPDTGASNDSIRMSIGGNAQITPDVLISAISANAGMYFVTLLQSNVSILGHHPLWYDQGDFAQHVATVAVVNNNPFSTQSNSLVTAIAAGSYSGVTIQGLSNYANISNVTLHAGTHSNATIQGISNYANISNVTLHAGTHSDVTIQGLTRALNLSANGDKTGYSLANAEYSAVTVRIGLVDYSGATVGAGNIAPGSYSDVSVSVRAGGIAASSHQAGALDAAALATDAGQEIADRVLMRSIEGGADSGRSVGHALLPLRNRVLISGSTGTVFLNDDTTSAWTFSVTTVAAVGISDFNPAD